MNLLHHLITLRSRWCGPSVILGAGVLALTGCGPAKQPAAARTAAREKTTAAAPPVILDADTLLAQMPRSTFSPQSNGSRDPFFPDAAKPAPALAQSAVTPPPARVESFSSQLKLNGLWPSRAKPLALINKTVFAPGERGSVTVLVANAANKIETRKVGVEVLEIRPDSVLISVQGEPGTKELLMQPRL